METRLCLTEQSNRVLLDEVLRLQSQLQKAVLASQEALAQERKSRDKLEAELIIIRDSLDNISQRLERVEGTSQLDRNSLIAVVNQARSLEQILSRTNQELRRDQGHQNVQIQEMRAELDEMSATHNRMESIVYNLADDMRNLKGTARMQYKQFRSVSAELNHKTDKIRHENKKVLDRIRACQDKTTQSEVNTANLRFHVGARMAEISDALLGLNEKVETSIQKQSQFEQRVTDRFDQVQALMDHQQQAHQRLRVNGAVAIHAHANGLVNGAATVNLPINGHHHHLLQQEMLRQQQQQQHGGMGPHGTPLHHPQHHQAASSSGATYVKTFHHLPAPESGGSYTHPRRSGGGKSSSRPQPPPRLDHHI